MNKPLVAAIAGVSFGIFLGGFVFKNEQRGTCPRRLGSAVQKMPESLPNAPPHSYRAASPCTRFDDKGLSLDEPDQDVLTEAQSAYVKGEFAQAIKLARTGEKTQPLRAWRILGASACNLSDLKLAEQAFAQVDAPARQYLIYVCQRNAISWHGKHFRLKKSH